MRSENNPNITRTNINFSRYKAKTSSLRSSYAMITDYIMTEEK